MLARRAAARFDAESLGLAGKLLELHPEVYTVWNYRREALGPVGDRALWQRVCLGSPGRGTRIKQAS